MSKTIGEMIRQARSKKYKSYEGTGHILAYTGGQRKELAKKLDITSGYLGHLENDAHVTISPRVVGRLEAVLGLKISAAMAEAHNAKSRKWYKAYTASKKQPKKTAAKPKQKVIRRRKPDSIMVSRGAE